MPRNRRILMITFHYPPIQGSSGVQRSLQFSRHLSRFGWDPIILTVLPSAYRRVDQRSLNQVPGTVVVKRTRAIDARRTLSVAGRAPVLFSLPDPWWSWWVTAVPAGLALARRHSPDVLWSTSPIPTAHLIANTLQRRTGLPLVADFRDPLGQDGYPSHRLVRRCFWSIERATVARAARCTFTTHGTLAIYASRYPDAPPAKWKVIENGYDEATFRDAETLPRDRSNGVCRLVHSGLLYPSERNPEHFFAAVATLLESGAIRERSLEIVLRAAGHDAQYRETLARLGIAGIVKLCPPVGYREALAEMLSADGLLLFQGPSCNQQIPAKAYEYIRAGVPILALTDPEGDTARLLRGVPHAAVARLDSASEIQRELVRFVAGSRHAPPGSFDSTPYSRERRAEELARTLDELRPPGA